MGAGSCPLPFSLPLPLPAPALAALPLPLALLPTGVLSRTLAAGPLHAQSVRPQPLLPPQLPVLQLSHLPEAAAAAASSA